MNMSTPNTSLAKESTPTPAPLASANLHVLGPLKKQTRRVSKSTKKERNAGPGHVKSLNRIEKNRKAATPTFKAVVTAVEAAAKRVVAATKAVEVAYTSLSLRDDDDQEIEDEKMDEECRDWDFGMDDEDNFTGPPAGLAFDLVYRSKTTS